MKNLNQPSVMQANIRLNSDNCLFVSGEIYSNGVSLFGTEVTLYENGIESQKFICCLNGFFYFRMDYEKTYLIKVEKYGCVSKTIEFDNHLFGHSTKRRYYEFGVNLSRALSEFPNDNSGLPAAKIRYSQKYDIFEHDDEYSKLRLNFDKNSNTAA